LSLSISAVTCTNQSLLSVVSVQQQWADDVYQQMQHKQLEKCALNHD